MEDNSLFRMIASCYNYSYAERNAEDQYLEEYFENFAKIEKLLRFAIAGREMLSKEICRVVHKQKDAKNMAFLNTLHQSLEALDCCEENYDVYPMAIIEGMDEHAPDLHKDLMHFISFQKHDDELLQLETMLNKVRLLQREAKAAAPALKEAYWG